MNLCQFVRFMVLMLGCSVLGAWIWTELAPAPPVNGGILSATGGMVGAVVGGVINCALILVETS